MASGCGVPQILEKMAMVSASSSVASALRSLPVSMISPTCARRYVMSGRAASWVGPWRNYTFSAMLLPTPRTLSASAALWIGFGCAFNAATAFL